VAERWVLNASPLIVLAHIGQEHLFQALADEVVILRAVVEEIEAGPAGDPARRVVAGGQFPVVDIAPSPEILTWDLGTGETVVLSFALAEPGWTVILDDATARKCAHERAAVEAYPQALRQQIIDLFTEYANLMMQFDDTIKGYIRDLKST